MKKVLIPVVALFALTITASAQDKMGKKKHPHRQQREMMARQLNLTEDQKSQAKAIRGDSRKKMQELNKNEDITVKEMRSRKAAIQKETKAKMDGLLTAEQKARREQLKADQQKKRLARNETRLNKMKTDLNLSEAQVSKLKAQQSAAQAKAATIRADESLSMEQKRIKLMALKTEAKKQHEQVLTAEQLKKKEEMMKTRNRRGQGDMREKRTMRPDRQKVSS